MARRISWTNNSTSYDGTNTYRAVTIDPQNLPAPLATVGSVAQGATVEYIDLTGSGDQCYAVRDFDSGGDGPLSDTECFIAATSPDSLDPSFNTDLVYTNDNKTAEKVGTGYSISRGAPGSEKSSGKWYYEITVDTLSNVISVGITSGDEATAPGISSEFPGIGYFSNNGRVFNQGSFTSHSPYVAGDVIAFAMDLDAGSVDIYKNNSLITTEATQAGITYYMSPSFNDSKGTVAFASEDLTFTPPSGYTPVGDV